MVVVSGTSSGVSRSRIAGSVQYVRAQKGDRLVRGAQRPLDGALALRVDVVVRVVLLGELGRDLFEAQHLLREVRVRLGQLVDLRVRARVRVRRLRRVAHNARRAR